MLSDQFLWRQQYTLPQKLLLFCSVKWASVACKITAKTSWSWLLTISQHGNFLAVVILDCLGSNAAVFIFSAGYGKMPGYEHIFTDFLQSLGQNKYQRCLSGGWSAGSHTCSLMCISWIHKLEPKAWSPKLTCFVRSGATYTGSGVGGEKEELEWPCAHLV